MRVADEFSRDELTEAMANIPKLKPQPGASLDMRAYMRRAERRMGFIAEAEAVVGKCPRNGACDCGGYSWPCDVCMRQHDWLVAKYGEKWWLT
jgi:hypothetical protein